jgi:arsenate reductase (glutaredoxin)
MLHPPATSLNLPHSARWLKADLLIGDFDMLMVYGIPHCDTVKKARAWLDERGVPFVFHDFKKQGVPADRLEDWIKAAGWETLVNRKGTTWRQLDEHVKLAVTDDTSAKALMLANASLIKRPVIERQGVFVGVGLAALQTPILPT